MSDILGYARVSTSQQDLSSQTERLKSVDAIKIFTDVISGDVISGKIFERNGLEDLIKYARPNDKLCVVRLDRLGRSLKELLETVERLKTHKIWINITRKK